MALPVQRSGPIDVAPGELVTQRHGLAASPLGRALRRIAGKDAPPVPPGGWNYRSLRGRKALPRSIQNYMDTYGGTDDSVVWVYACASLIADTQSGYPWDVMDPEDVVLQPADVPQELADLLDRPNRLLTYEDWVFWCFLDLELGGNSYWLQDQQNQLGQPFELLRLRPEYMRRVVDNQGRPAGHVYEVEGRRIPFSMDEILWYRYPDPRDELYGIGTVEAIQRELGADLAAREHVVGFYSQGGRVSGVVTVQGGLSQQAFDRIEAQFEEDAMVAGTDFRVLIIEQGNKFDPVTQAPGDTNVVPLQRMAKDRILAGFKVPEPLLGGVLENANYKITDSRYVFTDRMRPKANRFSTQTTIALVDKWDGLQFRLDPKVDLPPHEQAERAKNMAGTGPSLNQLLDAQGLPPIDDEQADEPLLLNTLMPASQVYAPPAPPPVAPPPPNGEPIVTPGTPGAPAGEGSDDNEPLPEEAPAGNEPSQLHVKRILAPRPRTAQQRRVKRAKSRFDTLGDTWEPPHVVRRRAMLQEAKEVEELAAAARAAARHALAAAPRTLTAGGSGEGVLPPAAHLALPPSPQDLGMPVVSPPLPEGYEAPFGPFVLKRARPAVAVRLLHHRADVLHRETPQIYAAMVDFFLAQRARVLAKLNEYGGSTRSIERGRKKKKGDLTGAKLWDDNAENEALLAAYLPAVDRIGEQAMANVGEMLGVGLRWDLQVPEVVAVRKRIADKVTRVNDTTRQAITGQVEVGLARGYSIVQIANGVTAEGYQGIVGCFDQATRYRAEMIARSETAMVYNDTANAGYQEAGVTEVEVLDGTGDEECAGANGEIWTLEEAQGDPIGHPNCVRSFVPILGDAQLAAQALDTATVHVAQNIDGKPWHIVADSSQCPASKPYAVVLDSTGQVVAGGCHKTRAEAEAHMRALYANE